MTIKVLVADDHPVVLSGICRELENGIGVEIVGRACNSTETLDILKAAACDVIVTDYSMPGGQIGDGLPMLQTLRRRYPGIRIVVITMLDNAALMRNIQKAGVSAILNKADSIEHIRPAVCAAFKWQPYLSPSVQTLLDTAGVTNAVTEPRLSRRELEVLRQCAAGVPMVEIARKANRSSKTISAQKSVAMKKLGLANDHELYQYALTHGLLSGAQ